MKYSLYDDYRNEFNTPIAIIPIKGFDINQKYSIEKINIYPKGSINEKELTQCNFDFSFEEIRTIFFDSVLITFPIRYDNNNMNKMCIPHLDEKSKLMKSVLDKTEDIMNIFRYIYSNFDKTSNLPQRSGYIEGTLSGFLMCNLNDKMSNYISEKYHVSNITIGNGLTVDVCTMKDKLDIYFSPLKNSSNEVGNIMKHAFRMYSSILYMPTATNKFMQAMSLIEYLANPFEYEKMQKVKTKIIPFSCDCKKAYHDMCERFKYLTADKDEGGNQIGLRTSIVHNGKNLEDLICEGYEIDLLLRELQMYICNFINNTIQLYDKYWNVVEENIKDKYEEMQQIKSGYNRKYDADCLIFIDFNFLNKAIEETFRLYPNHIGTKFNLGSFFYLLLKQTNIERNGYQIQINIIYENDEKFYNCSDERTISFLEALGFNSELGEISLYTKKIDKDYNLIMTNILNICLQEKNYYIESSTKFTKIVWVSDRNTIPDKIFEHAEKSCKKIILGRLDNARTTCYDKCTWFDIQYLIMLCLNIELYEECENNLIFKVEDGKYN